MRKLVLPEFQNYLRSKSLVNEKYIAFYAHWASEFLAFSASHSNLSRDLQIQSFFDYLRDQKQIADWQVKQALESSQLSAVSDQPKKHKGESTSKTFENLMFGKRVIV